jgi:hypothetical protein
MLAEALTMPEAIQNSVQAIAAAAVAVAFFYFMFRGLKET